MVEEEEVETVKPAVESDDDGVVENVDDAVLVVFGDEGLLLFSRRFVGGLPLPRLTGSDVVDVVDDVDVSAGDFGGNAGDGMLFGLRPRLVVRSSDYTVGDVVVDVDVDADRIRPRFRDDGLASFSLYSCF